MPEPWKTEKWWVSHFNSSPEALASATPPVRVELHEVMLREAYMTPGVVITADGVRRIVAAFAELGLKRIEATTFMPWADVDGDSKLVAELVRSFPQISLSLVCGDNRDYIDLAADIGVSDIAISAYTSDVLLRDVSHRTRDQVIDLACESVTYAKSKGLAVRYMLSDVGKTDLAFMRRVAHAVVHEAGGDGIVLTDTKGTLAPHAYAYLVSEMKRTVQVPIEVHCHNSFGLANANAIACYMAGASVIHTSFNGIGGLSGSNPPTEEMAMGLTALYGLDLGLQLEQLAKVSDIVADETGITMPATKPIVGAYVGAWEIAEKLRSMPGQILPMMAFLPEAVGRRNRVVLGRASDAAGVAIRLEEMAVSVSADVLEAIWVDVRQAGAEKRRLLTDGEFAEIARRHLP